MIFSIRNQSAQMKMHLLIPAETKAWIAQFAGNPSPSLRTFPMYYGVVTLCMYCVLGLPWASLKFPILPIQLPFIISCPWCNLLSPRMLYKGAIRLPLKNYFILWMVESINGDKTMSYGSTNGDFHQPGSSNENSSMTPYLHVRNHQKIIQSPESKVLNNVSFARQYFSIEKDSTCHSFALYAKPASAAILALYLLITVLFAFPSFLVLYVAYPSLDWLVREILT